jgi:uncharacterized protein
MKFVLFAFAVLVLLWLLRGGSRRVRPPSRPRADADVPAPQAMLSCAQCGIHMPRDEALPGRGGVFCSDAHRTAYEKAHPPA